MELIKRLSKELFSLNCTANMTSEQTKKESIKLFEKANKSIDIVAGNVNSGFYSDPDIIKVLTKIALKDNMSIRVLYDPERSSAIDASKIAGIKNINLVKSSKKPLRHVTIVDGKHVRIEQKHENDNSMTPAFICYDSSKLAGELVNKFNKEIAVSV